LQDNISRVYFHKYVVSYRCINYLHY